MDSVREETHEFKGNYAFFILQKNMRSTNDEKRNEDR